MWHADVLTDVLRDHAAAVRSYACHWSDTLGGAATADELVQEALTRLCRQPGPPAHVRAWLCAVVRNLALSQARSARRRRRHEGSAAAADAWFEEDHDAALDAELAVAALRTLPADQRETVVLHLWTGLSFREIADLTGATSSTAHRRYERALNALRERMGIHVGRE